MKRGHMDMQELYLDFKKIFFILIIVVISLCSSAFAEDINLEGKFGIGSSNTGAPLEIRYWLTSYLGIETGFYFDIYDKNYYKYEVDLKTPVVLKKINHLFLEITPKLSYYINYSKGYEKYIITEIYNIALEFYSEYFFNNNLSITLGVATTYKFNSGFTNREFYILDPSPFVLGFKFYFN